jgi:hypothetical protein
LRRPIREALALASATVVLTIGAASCGDRDDPSPAGSADPAATTAQEPRAPGPAGGKASRRRGSQDPSGSPGNGAGGSGNGAGGSRPGRIYGDGSIQRFGAPASGEDRSSAVAVARAFYAARAAGDWDRACDLMSSGIVDQLERARDARTKAPGCPSTLAALAGGVPSQLRRQQADTIRFTEIRVEGDRAHAVFESAAIPHGFLPMAREEGDWKVAAIAGSPL